MAIDRLVLATWEAVASEKQEIIRLFSGCKSRLFLAKTTHVRRKKYIQFVEITNRTDPFS